MHRCIKLNFTVRGKHFETDTKNCCACGKKFDGHLKEVLHQGSLNKMRAWIVAMRKEAITMNVNSYHQGYPYLAREGFEKVVNEITTTSTQARENVERCVQKKCKRAGKKGEQAVEGGIAFN